MTNTQSAFEARPIDDVKRALLERAQENRNPFLYTVFEEVAPVINGLRSVDREEWAKAFSALAAPHEERAAKSRSGGRCRYGEKRIFDRVRLQSCGPLSGAEFARQSRRLSEVTGIFSQGSALFRSTARTGRDAV
jgi:hypothetical protein